MVTLNEYVNFSWITSYVIYTILLPLPLALRLFFSDRTPIVKLNWTLWLLGVPILGVFMFILYGRKYVYSFSHQENLQFQAQLSPQTARDKKNNAQLLATKNLKHQVLLNHLTKLSSENWIPFSVDNEFKWYFDGNELFTDILQAAKNAKKSVVIECFTICDSEIFDALTAILALKVKQGVSVKILVDGAGSFLELPQSKRNKLKRLGIEIDVFFPAVYFMVGTRYNYRNHRKIVIIDDEVAFVGGFNFADEYNSKSARFGNWYEVNYKISGDAVASLKHQFLCDYEFVTRKNLFEKYVYPQLNYHNTENLIMLCGDGPNDSTPVHHDTLSFLYNYASKRIWIMTPYVILTEQHVAILVNQAAKGIDVKLFVPGRPDKKSVYRISAEFCEKLQAGGVKIYTYVDTFTHAKAIIIDDDITVCGSSNFDIRSMYQCFELMGIIVSPKVNQQLTAEFNKRIPQCKLQVPTIKNTVFQFVFRWLWRLLTPIY